MLFVFKLLLKPYHKILNSYFENAIFDFVLKPLKNAISIQDLKSNILNATSIQN